MLIFTRLILWRKFKQKLGLLKGRNDLVMIAIVKCLGLNGQPTKFKLRYLLAAFCAVLNLNCAGKAGVAQMI